MLSAGVLAAGHVEILDLTTNSMSGNLATTNRQQPWAATLSLLRWAKGIFHQPPMLPGLSRQHPATASKRNHNLRQRDAERARKQVPAFRCASSDAHDANGGRSTTPHLVAHLWSNWRVHAWLHGLSRLVVNATFVIENDDDKILLFTKPRRPSTSKHHGEYLGLRRGRLATRFSRRWHGVRPSIRHRAGRGKLPRATLKISSAFAVAA